MKSIVKSFSIIQLCLLMGAAFLLQSCTRYYYYGPGMLGGESHYQAKPHYSDSSRSRHYLSAGIHHNFKDGYQQNEESRIGTGNYHFALSRKNFSFATGAGLYYGDYKVTAAGDHFGKKEFWGASATTEIQLNVPVGPDNFKIMGFRQSMFYEDGPFYSFRKTEAQNSTNFINYSRSHLLFNTSVTSEYEITLNPFRFGMYGTLGITYDDLAFSSNTLSLGGFLYYRRLSGSLQLNISGKQGSNYSLGTSIGF